MFSIDTHIHTIASGHAYSTWKEVMDWASDEGMSHICVTDHGPKMPGAAHPFTIGNQAILPNENILFLSLISVYCDRIPLPSI